MADEGATEMVHPRSSFATAAMIGIVSEQQPHPLGALNNSNGSRMSSRHPSIAGRRSAFSGTGVKDDPLRMVSTASSSSTAAPRHASLAAVAAEKQAATSTIAGALLRLGEGRLRQGDVRGAYEDFREAARLEPTNQEAWSKYEETYRLVERLMDEEYAKSAAPASGRPLNARSQAGGLLGEALQSDQGSSEPNAPPRFSFVELPSSDDSNSDSSDEEEANSSWLQDGTGGGAGLGLGYGLSAGNSDSTATGRRGTQGSPSRRTIGPSQAGGLAVGSAPAAAPAAESRPAPGALKGQQVELTMPNSRWCDLTLMAWFVTCVLVISYYFFYPNPRLNKKYGFGAMVFVVVFFYLLLQASKRKQFMICSLRITIKTACVLVVIGCTAYHYYHVFQIRSQKTLKQKGLPGQTQPLGNLMTFPRPRAEPPAAAVVRRLEAGRGRGRRRNGSQKHDYSDQVDQPPESGLPTVDARRSGVLWS